MVNQQKFIRVTGAVTLGSLMTQNNSIGQSKPKAGRVLKANDLNNYLRSMYDIPEPSVDRIIIGDPGYPVGKMGLGTGCACDPLQYMEMGVELFNGNDNTIRTWVHTFYAEDTADPEYFFKINRKKCGHFH